MEMKRRGSDSNRHRHFYHRHHHHTEEREQYRYDSNRFEPSVYILRGRTIKIDQAEAHQKAILFSVRRSIYQINTK